MIRSVQLGGRWQGIPPVPRGVGLLKNLLKVRGFRLWVFRLRVPLRATLRNTRPDYCKVCALQSAFSYQQFLKKLTAES
ncbi:MAG: hypothetical protein IBX64_02625 [Actinobacteria bacterium]|nr:hypothetical protein [Actinomycetota bacterium]